MSNTKQILEYVWIDLNGNLRSKIKVNLNRKEHLQDFPIWNFDGSSTGQASSGNVSDVIIRPVRSYKNPFITNDSNSKIVLCECLNADMSAHATNSRDKCVKTSEKYKKFDCLFGIEQEYIILDKNGDAYDIDNIGDKIIYNHNQHYCSVGTGKAMGRRIAEEHMNMCLDAGIKVCGINSEVTASQWEFQIGPLNAFDVSNQLWVARYILLKVAEKYNAIITFHPKPFERFNGSGAHTNFSTREMREKGGLEKIYEAIEKLSKTHKEHIEVYGKYNDQRLIGKNETANINTFSYGNCDRSSSIRIPLNVLKDECGYLEDRRPAANMDPYLVCERILRTIFE